MGNSIRDTGITMHAEEGGEPEEFPAVSYDRDLEYIQGKPNAVSKKHTNSIVVQHNGSSDERKVVRPKGWETFTLCSPVLDAWARWDPSIITPEIKPPLSEPTHSRLVMPMTNRYMQGSVVHVPDHRLEEMLQLADFLLVTDLRNYCIHRIKHLVLDADSYYDILTTSSLYDFEHPDMRQYTRGNVLQLTKEKEMLSITYESVLSLITDEELTFWPMSDKSLFIINWCNAFEHRASHFQMLFNCLDLSRIATGFLKNVMITEKLVHVSTECLEKVNTRCTLNHAPVPFVFFLNNYTTGSNALGFSLEDKRVYKFKFPYQLMEQTNVITVCESGLIVSVKNDNIYEYNIHDNVCSEKKIFCNGRLTEDISHILARDDRKLFLRRNFSDPLLQGTHWSAYRGYTLFQKISEDDQAIHIEPVVTFLFDVRSACLFHSTVLVSSTDYVHRSKIFCFHLETNRLITLELPTDNSSEYVHCLLPVRNAVLAITSDVFQSLSFDKESDSFVVDASFNNWSRGFTRYIHLSNCVIEIKEKHIRMCYTDSDHIDYQRWSYYELEHVLNTRSIAYGYLERDRPLCHILCPHCDPYASEKEDLHAQMKQGMRDLSSQVARTRYSLND